MTDLAARRNNRTAAIMVLVVFSMIALAFASVPLYRLFCQVTGFGGTTQMRVGGEAPGAIGDRITVRFDATTAPSLPWRFRQEENRMDVAIGARNIAFYTARNLSARPVAGTATFNVTPATAGKYFAKIQCFCFTEQVLQPGEEMRMPVIFYVDPAILEDEDASWISEITLSYTFYPMDQQPPQS